MSLLPHIAMTSIACTLISTANLFLKRFPLPLSKKSTLFLGEHQEHGAKQGLFLYPYEECGLDSRYGGALP